MTVGTGSTQVQDNTRPFLHSSIMNFWIILVALSDVREYHIFEQNLYTRNVPVFTDTGMFLNPGPEVYLLQYRLT